ncbi:YoaH family protein [Actinobacillus delphinicola]
MGSGEAIAYVAAELRKAYQSKKSIGEMHAEDESDK